MKPSLRHVILPPLAWPFAALSIRRGPRGTRIFHRTDDMMNVVLFPFAVLAQLGCCWGFGLLDPGWAIGVVPLAVLLVARSGVRLRVRRGSVDVHRVFLGLPLPFPRRLAHPVRVERDEWEADFAVFLPSVVLRDRATDDEPIELRVQLGQDEALYRALTEALERHPPSPSTF